MIEIATPVSHLFQEAQTAEAIARLSDCLECRERNVTLSFPKEHLFHIDIDLTQVWEDQRQSYILSLIQAKPHLRLVSFQVTSCYSEPLLENRMFQPGGTRLRVSDMVAHAKTNVAWLRSILPKGIALAIENNNYYPTPAYEDVTEGDFLKKVVEETDIRFLLDIAHAMVSAHNLKRPYVEYLDSLPLSETIQLHICTPNLEQDVAYDAHELPNAFLFEEVQRLISILPVKYLTIEYYKDPNQLMQSLATLRQLIHPQP